jgi:hypothetical protein
MLCDSQSDQAKRTEKVLTTKGVFFPYWNIGLQCKSVQRAPWPGVQRLFLETNTSISLPPALLP